MDSSPSKCEVCFFTQSKTKSTFLFITVTTFITCKGCLKTAHRFCYLPECEGNEFICDVCQNKPKKHECCVCGNDGLLKRTEEGEYGHPVCLAMSKFGFVKSYKNFTFNYCKIKRNRKKGTCGICKKETEKFELSKCFDKNCSEMAHLYCILKDEWKDDKETNKWVQNLKIFNGGNINYISEFEEKVKKFVKNISALGYKNIYGDKKIREENPICVTYCPGHCENLTNCYCVLVEEEHEEKSDWVLCDCCGNWYHFNCENYKETGNGEYKCRCCRAWHEKIHNQKEPILKDYPKLHFYDLVYLQHYAEKKGYRLTANLKAIIKKVPLQVSTKYFSEITKSREMVTKVLNSINFIIVKNKFGEKNASKINYSAKNFKVDKELGDVLWKMDFLSSNEPLSAYIRIKKMDYKVEEIISIFSKFNKKFRNSSAAIEQAIKILSKKIKQENQLESDSEDEDISEKGLDFDLEIRKATSILKNQIEELKKMNTSNFKQVIYSYYTSFSTNELLKNLTKDYCESKGSDYELTEPVLLYDFKEEMLSHLEMKQYFKKFDEAENENTNRSKVQAFADVIEKIYENSTSKVKYQNLYLLREIHARGFGSEYDNDCNVNGGMIQEKQETNTISSCFFQDGVKYSSEWMISIEENIKNQLRRIWFHNLIKSLQIKESSITYLFQKYSKISSLMKNESSNRRFRSYLTFYESAKTLIESSESINEESKLNLDLLQRIGMTKIDKNNIYRFCSFFLNLRLVDFSDLNAMVEEVVRSKSLEFLTIIQNRSIIFQCEIEFKAASFLIDKFSFTHQKICHLFIKNRELIEMLKEVSFESLNCLNLIERDLNILNEAKEFCLENDLEFRISKIQHMIKLFECKIEALTYLPAKYIVKSPENLPLKYQNTCINKSLDFYMLRKINSKMNILKLPVTDHLYVSVNALIVSKTEYLNTLRSIISTYNIGLELNESHIKFPKHNKNDIIKLIEDNEQDFITCQPEEQEIKNIIAIYDQLVSKFAEMKTSKTFNENDMIKMFNAIYQLPFELEDKSQYEAIFLQTNLHTKHKEQSEDNIAEIIENTSNKKTELDETTTKMDSNRGFGVRCLIEEIKSKPRALTKTQIDIRLQKISNETHVQNEDLNEILMGYGNVTVETEIIEKFKKGQKLSDKDLVLAKKMIKNYQKQLIRIEDIESIQTQINIKEKVSLMEARNSCRIIKENELKKNSSGSSLASNKSTMNDQEEPGHSVSRKSKKHKYVL